MKNRDLVAKAAEVVAYRSADNASYGGVRAAVLRKDGTMYVGFCIDTMSGMGFCAEANAIGTMITDGGAQIDKMVAI